MALVILPLNMGIYQFVALNFQAISIKSEDKLFVSPVRSSLKASGQGAYL